MKPKDRDTIWQKSGLIYRYKCGRVDFEEEYIWESDRTFAERNKEYIKALSHIHDHRRNTGHDISIDNFSIVGIEGKNLVRFIKEAIFFRVNNPSLNRNIGKHQLPHRWDEILMNSPELNLRYQANITSRLW